MKSRGLEIVAAAVLLLNACSGPTQSAAAMTPAVRGPGGFVPALRSTVPSPAEVANLDYSTGSISVFRITNGRASLYHTFKPSKSGAQGIAVDAAGLVYTTVTAANANPCAACAEVFTPAGQLVARWPAPILTGAPGAPSLSDLALDARGNVYVSDYGQQAVYFYPSVQNGSAAPTIVVQNSQNAASVVSTPNGDDVFVSGGCGFASVRTFARTGPRQYQAGSCFGIGTVALIGGAADNDLDVFTPVDGVPALVSVSSPSGGTLFQTPDQPFASISGVSLNADGSVAYVANHHKEVVYAFARPAKGWIDGGQPKLVATYTGFKHLDIIAVQP